MRIHGTELTYTFFCHVYRNMFLAAAPYFLKRFRSKEWAVRDYQPSILSVSTVTNLVCAWILAKLQKNATYPKRIIWSLIILSIVFSLLAFSTVTMRGVSVAVYFVFVMFMVFGAALATGMNQNGVFAYVAGFGQPAYTQAIMAGQGVAGVLPCIVQILSVLAVPADDQETDLDQQESGKSAFAYFTTATAISALTLVAFLYLVRRTSIKSRNTHHSSLNLEQDDNETADDSREEGEQLSRQQHQIQTRKTVGLWTLFLKLHWPALALFLCFAITMVFPVFTTKIESVQDPANRSRLFEPAIFIPLGFFFWNAGDLTGRLLVLIPSLAKWSQNHPFGLFIFALARLAFIPLYLMCNIRNESNSNVSSSSIGGVVVRSDAFYLFIVQLFFGLTNGFLGSSCMMGASQWVSPAEREAAGGFMSMMLVAGLAVGSILSFIVAELV